MAEMIPDCLGARATASERRLFTALERLPADCLVYYEPIVANRYPDFIVIIPGLGVLTIELKGWRAGDIAGADTHAVFLRELSKVGGTETITRRNHPVRQARDYMFALMDRCRQHRHAASLLQAEGAHQGSFCFPFSHVAILANISVEQLKHHPAGDLTEVFPAQRVLPRDALLHLENASPEEMLASLRACFDPSWAFPPLTEEQVNSLRAMIHPEIVLTTTLPGFETKSEGEDFIHPHTELAATSAPPRSSTAGLKVLDLRQERHARQIGTGHRLVFGVAGSGKTVLLIARARLLAAQAQRNGKVLVLCYNVMLAAYLRAVLSDCAPGVAVFHFDGWAARQGVVRDAAANESNQGLGERLLAALQDGTGDVGSCSAVLIDEAQDFEPSWFRCALAAMKDPEGGDLLIVGDGSQGLYRQRKVSWKELGIQAKGRSVSVRFELDRNYRNSREIISLAHAFAELRRSEAEDTEDAGVSAPVVDLTKCCRSTGVLPVLVPASDRLDECRRAWTLVRDLLHGRWAGCEVPPLAPGEIAILYPRLGTKAAHVPLLRRFIAGLEKLAPTLWLSDPDSRTARTQVSRPGVKVQTIHSAKGLQYRAVILLWAGDLPGRFSEVDVAAERRLFYVGLTRAEDFLALCHSDPNAPFVAEAQRLVQAA